MKLAELLELPERGAAFDDEGDAFRSLPRRLLSAPAIGSEIAASSYRDAGRRNALAATDRELQSLLDERKALLNKKLAFGTLDDEDADRLEYVRWSLDRIEDARHGHELDRLQHLVELYKSELRDLQTLNSTLRGQLPRKKK